MKLFICTKKQCSLPLLTVLPVCCQVGTCLCEKDYGLKTSKMNHEKYLYGKQITMKLSSASSEFNLQLD